LLVSHSWESTDRDRTLKSLYLDPLSNIFKNRNVTTANEEDKQIGVFETDPSATTVLLIDFKNDGAATWPVLLRQLAPLREKNWLTYYDGETLHQGSLTIVGTGRTPFDLIQSNSTDRYIFFDAPLLSISDPQYNTTNSYYASAPLKRCRRQSLVQHSFLVTDLHHRGAGSSGGGERTEEQVLGYAGLADWTER
jgi:hypothetical protein